MSKLIRSVASFCHTPTVRRQRRLARCPKTTPLAWLLLASIAVLNIQGCGGGDTGDDKSADTTSDIDAWPKADAPIDWQAPERSTGVTFDILAITGEKYAIDDYHVQLSRINAPVINNNDEVAFVSTFDPPKGSRQADVFTVKDGKLSRTGIEMSRSDKHAALINDQGTVVVRGYFPQTEQIDPAGSLLRSYGHAGGFLSVDGQGNYVYNRKQRVRADGTGPEARAWYWFNGERSELLAHDFISAKALGTDMALARVQVSLAKSGMMALLASEYDYEKITDHDIYAQYSSSRKALKPTGQQLWVGKHDSLRPVLRSSDRLPAGLGELKSIRKVLINSAGSLCMICDSTDDYVGVLSGPASRLRPVVERGMTMPGIDEPHKLGGGFSSLAMNDVGEVAFVGIIRVEGEESIRAGAWKWRDGSLKKIWYGGDGFPGLDSGMRERGRSIIRNPLLFQNKHGQVAMWAPFFKQNPPGSLRQGYSEAGTGVWATDRDGALRPVLVSGMKLDVNPSPDREDRREVLKVITHLGDQIQDTGQRILSDSGKVVVLVKFSDESEAIVLAQMPRAGK